MSVPLEQITPGVWEVQCPHGVRHVVWIGQNLLCWLPDSLPNSSRMVCHSVDHWVVLGWRFTARYVRCEGEPVECWANLEQKAVIPVNDLAQTNMTRERLLEFGYVRGLFAPQGDE